MTDNETEREAAKVSRRWPLISGAVAVLLVAGLGALIAVRGNLPSEVDAEWMEEIVEHRSAWWEVPSIAMNHIGGGIFGVFILPILIIAVLCLFRRFVSALYFLISTVLSAGIVQLLKNIYDRPRPEEIMVVSDIGSFPSGHSANAATMAVVLGFIVRRLWVWVAGIAYTVVMVLSRTYLGAHWITDTIAGVVLGAAVAVIVWAPFAHRLHLERKNPPRMLFARKGGTPLPR
jgi:membrane-associated phospholipid phosphatase